MQGRDSVYEDSTWEATQFDNEELSITKSIVARGQFGSSYMLGKIRPARPLPPKIDTMVMMKTCNDNGQEKCYNGLKAELNILYDLCHTNVIQLVGFSSEEQSSVFKNLTLVFEYCSNGNLLKVLQKGRHYFDGTYSPKKAINNEILSPGIFLNFCGWHLLQWSTEIARGMDYLTFKGVVHGDLSARNVLLTCDWTTKICNFGISKRQKIQEESYAIHMPKEVLPYAWMAPEVIKYFNLSELSDVWSYGITLWEIYTLGDTPYIDDNVTIDSYPILLLENIRPAKPSHANEHIWSLINACWAFHSKDRPSFSKVLTFLEKTVVATKSDWKTEATLSGHACSGEESTGPKKKTRTGKSVTFAPEGNFFRKCFAATDDILFHRRLNAP